MISTLYNNRIGSIVTLHIIKVTLGNDGAPVKVDEGLKRGESFQPYGGGGKTTLVVHSVGKNAWSPVLVAGPQMI